MIKLAFGSVPKDGGTFTFYRNLRPVLLEHDIDMRCVSVGKAEALLWEDSYADEGCVSLAPETCNVKKQAITFVEWCQEVSVDIVIGVNSRAILSAFPHLPERIRVMSRCANGFDHGYRITMSGGERLARIIALTPRLAHDLISYYGADPEIVHLIPNGIAPGPFDAAAETLRGQDRTISLGFLGRLEHNQKGVLHLPKLVRELNARDVAFRLRIAGKGKHKDLLERELLDEIEIGQIDLVGALTPNQVPQFLGTTDIFVFTSHFEGCPNALLEALMAGCVPVAWLIEGTTDFILSEGKTGYLCATEDYSCFADHIEHLAIDRGQLQTMSTNASYSARRHFSHQQTATAYASLIREVMSEPPPPWAPRKWQEFKIDPNFGPEWRDWLRSVGPVSWLRDTFRDFVPTGDDGSEDGF